MSFEEIARRMNERAGGQPGMPVDVAEVKRKYDRFEAGVMVWGGLSLAATSFALNVWLAMTGWVYSAGVLLTVLGIGSFCIGVKQFAQNLFKPRKVRLAEARVRRPAAHNSSDP